MKHKSIVCIDVIHHRCQRHDGLGYGGLDEATDVGWKDAVWVANVAAGLEVEHFGVTPITRQQICTELVQLDMTPHTKMVTLPQMRTLVASYRHCGKKLVFTNGRFDLLHIGHVSYLLEAAKLGDVLIVALNSDASVRRLKGPQRPVVQENDRAKMLAALSCVDYVLIFEDNTPHQLLRELQPDLLVKGGTYQPEEVIGHEIVADYGGKTAVLGLVEGVSTTAIISNLLTTNQALSQPPLPASPMLRSPS